MIIAWLLIMIWVSFLGFVLVVGSISDYKKGKENFIFLLCDGPRRGVFVWLAFVLIWLVIIGCLVIPLSTFLCKPGRAPWEFN